MSRAMELHQRRACEGLMRNLEACEGETCCSLLSNASNLSLLTRNCNERMSARRGERKETSRRASLMA